MDRFGIHKDPGHKCRICDVIHFLFCTTGGPKGLVSFLAVCCVIKKDVKQQRAIKYRPSISWKQGFHQPENKQFEENHGCWCQKHVRPPLLAFHKAIQKYFCFDDKAKISGSLSVSRPRLAGEGPKWKEHYFTCQQPADNITYTPILLLSVSTCNFAQTVKPVKAKVYKNNG